VILENSSLDEIRVVLQSSAFNKRQKPLANRLEQVEPQCTKIAITFLNNRFTML